MVCTDQIAFDDTDRADDRLRDVITPTLPLTADQGTTPKKARNTIATASRKVKVIDSDEHVYTDAEVDQ